MRTFPYFAALLCALSLAIAVEAASGPGAQSLDWYTDDRGAVQPVQSPADWHRRRAQILTAMQDVMGPLPDRANLPPLDTQVLAIAVGDGYTRQTIRFTSGGGGGNGDHVPAYLYLPNAAAPARRAAIIAMHPTGAPGKDLVDTAGKANRTYAAELAQRGYVVIAPDYPSFGDLKDYDFAADTYVSGTMKGIANHMRCVDLLVSLDNVDPRRIGVIGHSLGGHNALFHAAFDDRVKVAVTSCGWTPFHRYYGGKKLVNWAQERYMPHVRDVYDSDPDRMPFDFQGVIAAIAPRAVFSASPLHDSNFDVAGVRLAEPEIRTIYRLLGVDERFVVTYPDCEHDFPPEVRRAAYDFIDAQLAHQPQRDPR